MTFKSGFKEKEKSIKGKNIVIAEGLKIEDLHGTDLWDFGNKIKEALELPSNAVI